MKFKKFNSFNNYLNDKLVENINKKYNLTGTNRRDLKKELAALNIFYETSGYEEVTERESIDFVSLLSNIGGIAGLFLGISVLSLVEIIELGFKILHVLIEIKKVRKIPTPLE
ncbi:unnamed protein product [Brachionus calyciflorus]|uniref:Uncharacterized protein n=1 Tax=Brachionus calyciflorus TaxID=104777 RepID=A0A814KSN3_9BILA|nr:unnamed protein product [Brachionus calyciflorus]